MLPAPAGLRFVPVIRPRVALVTLAVLGLLPPSFPASAQSAGGISSPTGSPRSDGAIAVADVAERAGLTLLNVHGDATKDYVIDANGNGAAWFDYDGDDDLDALLVNGSTREHVRQGGDPMVALYRNDGPGSFVEVTPGSGLERRGWGMGACVADYDNDGDHDLYVTAFGPNALFRNEGDGTFEDVTEAAGVGDARWGMNCAFGDYDRDGDVDLYVANHLAFSERMIPGRRDAICRYEDLEIYCGPRGLEGEADVLYRNNGDGTFTDVTSAAGITDPGYYGFGVLFSDLDDDGWPDIFVANDSVPNLLFRNNRDGTFTEEGLVRGVALGAKGEEQAGMGVTAGDYNGDGRLDLVVTNFSEDYNTLYENDALQFFTDATARVGLGLAARQRLGWGTGLVDLDNDGWLDLFVANGHVYPDIDTLHRGPTYRQANQVFRNLGGRRFEDVSDRAGSGLRVERSSRGTAFGDYDNDGDIDMLVININDRPTLLRNDTKNGNHWLTLRLVGGSTPLITGGSTSGSTARAGGSPPDGVGATSNRDGIGARILVTAGGRTQVQEVRSGESYLSHNDLRVHFGLGDVTDVDRIEIRWPSRRVETFDGLAVDRFHVVREGTGQPVVRGGTIE